MHSRPDRCSIAPTQAGAFLRTSAGARALLLAIVLLSTSMIIGDGVLTPAISVISAVIGIQVAAPSIDTSARLACLLKCMHSIQPPHSVGYPCQDTEHSMP